MSTVRLRQAPAARAARGLVCCIPGLALVLLGLAPVVIGLTLVGPAAAQETPESASAAPPDTLLLVLADWRVQALGHQASGRAAWIRGRDGAVRVDLVAEASGSESGPEAAADPLRRLGEGWTLVAGADGDGVYGAWDREWRTPPAGLAALVRAITDPGRADRSGGSRLTLGADPAAAAGETPPAGAAQAGFRRSLVRRARGGGGPGERLSVSSPGGGDHIRVRSSRRPGRLDIMPTDHLAALGVAAEVFLPWWSLQEVLTVIPAGNPGTSVPGPR